MFDAASFFQWFVENASYLFVFVFMVIESSFIPFPSEVVVPPAAYLACTTGDMNVVMIVVVATLGAIVGALINYYLAVWIGRPVVYRFANSRWGRLCLLDTQKVEKAEAYFYKHGAISTLIGRLIPAVRQLISIPAGLAKMNIITFIVFTALGAMIWNIILAVLGYWLGGIVSLDNLYVAVEEYNQYLTWAGIGIGVLFLMFILWTLFKPKTAEPK
ncbi:MAG: DedA family protein [Alistipes sp.]|nr:DedA family protein [Alistipes sp.]